MSISINKLSQTPNPSTGETTTIYKLSDQNMTILWDKEKECWVQITDAAFASTAEQLNQLGLQVRLIGDGEFELYYNDIKFSGENNKINQRKLLGGSGSAEGTVDSIHAEKVIYYNELTEATNVKENLDEINSTLVGLADYLSTL